MSIDLNKVQQVRGYVSRDNGQIYFVTDHLTTDGLLCSDVDNPDPWILEDPNTLKTGLLGVCSICSTKLLVPYYMYHDQQVRVFIDCQGVITMEGPHNTPAGNECENVPYDPLRSRRFIVDYTMLGGPDLGHCYRCRLPVINYPDMRRANG